jgi:organic hydroperoxide reductase OsmC/OhrA
MQELIKEGGCMKPLPHRYEVTAIANEHGHMEITSNGLPPLASAPPAEFGGPGNLWSPETLTVAAVADCFVLTFRAIANASKLRWASLVCDARGTLDRSDEVIRFTAVQLHAHLLLPEGGDADKAQEIIEKAHKGCLVGNSLKFEPALEAEITVEEPALAPTA